MPHYEVTLVRTTRAVVAVETADELAAEEAAWDLADRTHHVEWTTPSEAVEMVAVV